MRYFLKILVIFLFLECAFTEICFTVNAKSRQDRAREFVLTGKIGDAIAAYALLTKSAPRDAKLVAEYAYALALGGFNDIALTHLDRARQLGQNPDEVYYFTSQVFALMGYDDIASGLWLPSLQFKTPKWIAPMTVPLLKRYRRKLKPSKERSREKLVTEFKNANQLAAQRSYFQSIALFQDIIDQYPDEYLPYVGFSIALEKVGAYTKAAQATEQAILLLGKGPDSAKKRRILEQQLERLKEKVNTHLEGTFPEEKPAQALFPQRFMVYGGGGLSSISTNFSGRLGVFNSDRGNGALDFGVNVADTGDAFFNIGIGSYSYKPILKAADNTTLNFVSGIGMRLYTGGGSSTLSSSYTLGLSFLEGSRTFSFDFMIDFTLPLIPSFSDGGSGSISMVIGPTFYFGKRK